MKHVTLSIGLIPNIFASKSSGQIIVQLETGDMSYLRNMIVEMVLRWQVQRSGDGAFKQRRLRVAPMRDHMLYYRTSTYHAQGLN